MAIFINGKKVDGDSVQNVVSENGRTWVDGKVWEDAREPAQAERPRPQPQNAPEGPKAGGFWQSLKAFRATREEERQTGSAKPSVPKRR